MDSLKVYQTEAFKTSKVTRMPDPAVYSVMGLCSEAGEVAGKLKKIFRDKNGEITPEDALALKKELGDCLWYIADTCSRLGFSLDEVAQMNIDKLRDRHKRDTIKGDGDDR